jgi:hypothetical protein
MPVGTRSNTRRTSTSSFISGPPRDQERSPARPPPQHSQEDAEEQTPKSGSPHICFSPSTTKTSATGLSLHVQKSLLQDIEESGGLVVACVRNLCNRRSDIFGAAGSERRRQVQNKVTKWKSLDEIEYYKLLASLGVRPRSFSTPPALRPNQPPSSSITSPPAELSRSSPSAHHHYQLLTQKAAQTSSTPEKKSIKSMAARNLVPLLEDDDYGTRATVLLLFTSIVTLLASSHKLPSYQYTQISLKST